MGRGEPPSERDAELVSALERALSAVKPLLPAISYDLPFGTPYDRGILLVQRPYPDSPDDGVEKLYLAEEGFFFFYDEDGIKSYYYAERIVSDGWDVLEIVLVIAKAVCLHLDKRKTEARG